MRLTPVSDEGVQGSSRTPRRRDDDSRFISVKLPPAGSALAMLRIDGSSHWVIEDCLRSIVGRRLSVQSDVNSTFSEGGDNLSWSEDSQGLL